MSLAGPPDDVGSAPKCARESASGIGGAALHRVREGVARAVSESAVLADEELNAALEPFRGRHPIRIACRTRGCGKTFSWWAFHPDRPLVVFDFNAPRKRELDRGDLPGGPWLSEQPPEPFNYWSTGPQMGLDSAAPVGLPGEERLRRSFACPKCESKKTLTNSKMIELLAKALAGNQREIRV